MPLRKPRKGIYAGFHKFPNESFAATLGEPEKIIWASIKHLCARDVAYNLLYFEHNIKSKRTLEKISKNLKIYINHAYEFYNAAGKTDTNTAPLIYYYSFLNLAKALCEIKYPGFHKYAESYKHGISWKPNKDYFVNLNSEIVSITTRGIWHVLMEVTLEKNVSYTNPLILKIKDLFAFGAETSIEYESVFSEPARLIDFDHIGIYLDPDAKELWLHYVVNKQDLKRLRMTRPKLLKLITPKGFKYEQVESENEDTWTFESTPPIKFKDVNLSVDYKYVRPLVKPMNLFVHLFDRKLIYSIPIQDRLPIQLPQLNVLYTLMFWLGSLVRYDPHSVADLQESRDWMLIDGFIIQSRIWLLELFEMHFYRTDTHLSLTR